MQHKFEFTDEILHLDMNIDVDISGLVNSTLMIIITMRVNLDTHAPACVYIYECIHICLQYST